MGRSLVFIVSQPRAGSTLLQRILGSHPSIRTVSEPWLMLHPLYALRPEGYEAEYNACSAYNALQNFLQALPDGEDEYIEAVRRMYTYLYERTLVDSGKQYFLDKTPRYYFIIPELYRVFPKAHYVILLRNPVAVLRSVVKTWIREEWFRTYEFKHDLVHAPRLLLKGAEVVGDEGVVVHYEQLVRDPASEVQRVCNRLGIEFIPSMIEYGRHDLARWRYGDREEVYEHTRPTPENTEKWIQALDNPQIWRVANDYLHMLGKGIVDRMGYSYEELQQVLDARQPHPFRLWFTLPLPWLLERRRMYEAVGRRVARVIRSVRVRGARGTAAAVARRTVSAMTDFRSVGG